MFPLFTLYFALFSLLPSIFPLNHRKIDCLECLKDTDELGKSLGGDLRILTLIDLKRFLLKKCMGPRQIPRPDIVRKSCERSLNNERNLLEEFVAEAKAGKSADYLCHNVFLCVDH